MRLLRLLLIALLAAALVGCGGGSDDGDDAGAGTPTATTPDELRSVVWERSYSECAMFDLASLAGKYRVEASREEVSEAVGRAWASQFNAADDAIASGRDGCIQGIDARDES
jgi:hypothetical protein